MHPYGKFLMFAWSLDGNAREDFEFRKPSLKEICGNGKTFKNSFILDPNWKEE